VSYFNSRVKGTVMERRGATRYQLRFVVAFSWKDESNVIHGSEGQSRDLNGRGIYVHSTVIPPVGSYVEMSVLLPQLDPPKRPAEVHAEGRVVRIDAATGFAAMNHTVILRDAEGRKIDGDDAWNDYGLGRSKDR
jgi:hypothetical protein